MRQSYAALRVVTDAPCTPSMLVNDPTSFLFSSLLLGAWTSFLVRQSPTHSVMGLPHYKSFRQKRWCPFISGRC